jgi:hypothetical protein
VSLISFPSPYGHSRSALADVSLQLYMRRSRVSLRLFFSCAEAVDCRCSRCRLRSLSVGLSGIVTAPLLVLTRKC